MNNKRFLFVGCFFILIVFNCSAQERIPGNRIKPVMKTLVGQNGNSFLYHYRLSNGQSAEQDIWQFELHLSPDISIQSVGSPVEWGGSYLNEAGDLMVHWGTPTGGDVKSGQSVEGFSVSAISIPGIVSYYAEGWVQLPDSIPEDSEADSIYHNLTPYGPGVIGKTIGPVLPPEPFIATAFLDILLSHTRQSVALGWLKSGRDNDCDGDEKPQDGVSKNFEKRLNKVRTELTKGNNLKASRELEKFIKKVERISKRTEVMTSEAYALLKYNAEYLVGRIITLPTKPTGTLLQQIDELKAELTRQQGKKKIRGVLLVKSLTFLADQGEKQLQKPLPSSEDSAKAALFIASFQLLVGEIWESTELLTKKNKKFIALYVNDEAYIQLHYRAKYILEALPAPRTLIDMKSVEMDDDVRKELDAMRKMTKEQ